LTVLGDRADSRLLFINAFIWFVAHQCTFMFNTQDAWTAQPCISIVTWLKNKIKKSRVGRSCNDMIWYDMKTIAIHAAVQHHISNCISTCRLDSWKYQPSRWPAEVLIFSYIVYVEILWKYIFLVEFWPGQRQFHRPIQPQMMNVDTVCTKWVRQAVYCQWTIILFLSWMKLSQSGKFLWE
jgi:hypothetical protein